MSDTTKRSRSTSRHRQEKITLVHIGEKLIILFDNQSTVTVEPFFDSRHDAWKQLSIEVAPGREFRSASSPVCFPSPRTSRCCRRRARTEMPASGANFSSSSVDPLGTGNPLDLLGQEELGNLRTRPANQHSTVERRSDSVGERRDCVRRRRPGRRQSRRHRRFRPDRQRAHLGGRHTGS